jgi:hypothetical protein
MPTPCATLRPACGRDPSDPTSRQISVSALRVTASIHKKTSAKGKGKKQAGSIDKGTEDTAESAGGGDSAIFWEDNFGLILKIASQRICRLILCNYVSR